MVEAGGGGRDGMRLFHMEQSAIGGGGLEWLEESVEMRKGMVVRVDRRKKTGNADIAFPVWGLFRKNVKGGGYGERTT